MIDTTALSKLVAALRAQTTKDSISPEDLGSILQQMLDLMATATTKSDIDELTKWLDSLKASKTVLTTFKQGSDDDARIKISTTAVNLKTGATSVSTDAIELKQATTSRAGVMKASMVSDLAKAKEQATSATSDIKQLQSKLSSETSSREALKSQLQSEIVERKAVQADLKQEIADRKAADEALQTSIENEVAARKAADTDIKEKIGLAGGIAPLNSERQIDSSYLPDYVRDIIILKSIESAPSAPTSDLDYYFSAKESQLYQGQFYSGSSGKGWKWVAVSASESKLYIDGNTNTPYRIISSRLTPLITPDQTPVSFTDVVFYNGTTNVDSDDIKSTETLTDRILFYVALNKSTNTFVAVKDYEVTDSGNNPVTVRRVQSVWGEDDGSWDDGESSAHFKSSEAYGTASQYGVIPQSGTLYIDIAHNNASFWDEEREKFFELTGRTESLIKEEATERRTADKTLEELIATKTDPTNTRPYVHLECDTENAVLTLRGAADLIAQGYKPLIFRYTLRQGRCGQKRDDAGKRKAQKSHRGWHLFYDDDKLKFEYNKVLFRIEAEGITNEYSTEPNVLFHEPVKHYDKDGSVKKTTISYGKKIYNITHGRRFKFAIAFAREPKFGEPFDFTSLVTPMMEFKVHVQYPKDSLPWFAFSI